MKKIKFFISMIVLIVVDQLVKIVVVKNADKMPFDVIPNFLKFSYCENKGMAFGMGTGKINIIAIVTFIVIACILYIAIKKYQKLNLAEKIGILMLLAGSISNLIDRIFRRYVVDYIDISSIFSFPIFNIADILVVVGGILVVIAYCFSNRGEKIENSSK